MAAYRFFGLVVAALVAVSAWYAFSPRPLPAFPEPRIHADRVTLLDVAKAAGFVVAVGEKGIILRSEDQGKSWLPAVVKNTHGAPLTALWFADDGALGIAVGHEGTVLRSTDAGRVWQEVAFDQENGTPLLAIAQASDGNLWAGGAFGRLLKSTDQGQTWQQQDLGDIPEMHFNSMIADANGRLLIAGEAGTLLRSLDAGKTWQQLASIYPGSFFDSLIVPATDGSENDLWLILGMRGHVFSSRDHGEHWQQAKLDTNTALFGGAFVGDHIYLAGQGGTLMVSDDGGDSFSLLSSEGAQSLAAIAVLDDQWLLLAGEIGVKRHALSGHSESNP